MEGDNDDDELSFIQLAAVTANVVRWLMETHNEKQNQNGGSNGETNKSDEQKQEGHRKYVQHRLRELREFEQRARGEK